MTCGLVRITASEEHVRGPTEVDAGAVLGLPAEAEARPSPRLLVEEHHSGAGPKRFAFFSFLDSTSDQDQCILAFHIM